MPATAHDPSKPTMYFDWSHFAAAERSRHDPTHAKYAPLLELIDEVAHSANLCLSVLHLAELAGAPEEHALRTAMWLDALRFVWIQSPAEKIELDEVDATLLRALRPHRAPFSPFRDPFAEFPGRTLSEHVGALRKRGVNNVRAASLTGAARLHEDRRQAAAEGLTADDVNRALDHKLTSALAQLLYEAHERLRQGGYRAAAMHEPTIDEVTRAISELVADSRSMPGLRIGLLVTRGFTDAIQVQDPKSKRFTAHASAANDHHHCTSGIYCDIFTCDARTAAQLGSARESFGKQRQLCEAEFGSVQDFADAVHLQLEVAEHDLANRPAPPRKPKRYLPKSPRAKGKRKG